MLNEVLLSRLDTELSGKYVSYTAAEKKELRRTMRWHFGKDTFQGSIYELYEQFLRIFINGSGKRTAYGRPRTSLSTKRRILV